MKKPPAKRIDTGKGTPLDYQPFAALVGNDVPASAEPPAQTKAAPAPQPTASPYKVTKSRKGNWPLQVERRAGGKFVTIVNNIEGDGNALLRDLRKFCGAGGVLREGAVEIQGDQSEKVKRFLEGT